MLAIPATFCACSDDDDESIITDIPSTAEEDTTEADDITLDSESLKLVGRWSGKGPSADSENYTIETGTWQFHNDGTYEWYTPGNDGKDEEIMSGTWSYSGGNFILDSNSGFGWTTVTYDATTDEWTGTAMDDGTATTFTYTRKTDKSVKPGIVKVLNYRSGAFSVRDTIKNYKLCGETIKCGICYAKSDADPTDKSTWTKVYADNLKKINSSRGIYDVEIDGLEDDAKYYLCGFMEAADGTLTYGSLYRAICVTPPANTVCMGDTTFWCTSELTTLYTDEEVDAALATVGGALPTVAETEYLTENSLISVEAGRIVLKSKLNGNTMSLSATVKGAANFSISGTYMTTDFRRQDASGFYFYKSTTAEGLGSVPDYQSKVGILPVIKKAVTWEE